MGSVFQRCWQGVLRLLSVEAVLGPGGRLSRVLQRPEVRPGQIEMARVIAAALDERRHVAVEAGTGTGKSLAAMVPAALHAARTGRRVVIAPHTLQLQEQLARKDGPVLAELLAPDIRVTLATLKGRRNYLCPLKLYRLLGRRRLGYSGSPRVRENLERLVDWLQDHRVSEREEVPFPVLPEAWAEVTTDASACPGGRCRYFSACPYYRAQRTAAKATIVVANQALVFADLALRSQGREGALPEYDVVILDEAHHLEDSATHAWQVTVDAGLFEASARLVEEFGRLLGRAARHRLEAYASAIKSQGGAFLAGLGDPGIAREPRGDTSGLRAIRDSLFRELDTSLTSGVSEEVKEAGEAAKAAVEDAVARAEAWSSQTRAGWGYWVEQEPSGRRRAHMAPVEVAPLLREHLFHAKGPVVICMSATLSEAMLRRVGFPQPEVVRVASPFHYERQSVLYVPKRARDPRDPDYDGYVVQSLVQLLYVSRGRALVLFTSWDSLSRVYAEVAPILRGWGYTPLRQGELPRAELVQQFRSDVHSCLFGVSSLWEGVDVPGVACSVVVLTRLPFSVPTEPLAMLRAERAKASGQDPFLEVILPEAVVRFRQGFGRLIRSVSDRGVVAVLDARILTSSYGQMFRTALQEVPLCRNLEGVYRVLVGHVEASA